MAAEASVSVRTVGTSARNSASATPVLTRLASLNAAASLIDYTAKVVTGLIVTPILLGALGRSLFGAWEVLNRLVNYMQAADGRPTQALRLVIAQQQNSIDTASRRRAIGAALAVWVILLPVVLVASVLFVRFAPQLAGASADVADEVRLTCVLLLLSFLIAGLAAVPESVLRGMNLGYRRMGWQASLSVLGGVLAAFAAASGFGLLGLGTAQIILWAVTAVCFLWLVRSSVPWFGADRPSRTEVRTLLGMSVWLSLGELVARIMLASDVILLGALIGPEIVTTYVITSNAARVATGVHQMVASSAFPGIGGMLGDGQFDRAARTRQELMTLSWVSLTVIGAALLLWNQSFVALWVGPRNYAGTWPNLLVTLIAVQTAFIRVDAYVIDAALRPRQRVIAGAFAAVVTLVLGTVLTKQFGLIGLCLAILASRATQSIAYPMLARSSLRRAKKSESGPGIARRAVITVVLFVLAAAAGHRLLVSSWLLWAAGVLLTVPLISAFALVAGLDRKSRQQTLMRVHMILPRRASP